MIEIKYTGNALWARIDRAIAKVEMRLRKTVAALTQAEIPHAIVGGHAANFWISRVDESAVRVTPDVEVLIANENLPRAIQALVAASFDYQPIESEAIFRDHGSTRGTAVVRLRPDATPLEKLVAMDVGQTLPIEAFVRLCLTRHRNLDCLHLRDMIDVALVDASWLPRLPPELAARLKQLLDTPHG